MTCASHPAGVGSAIRATTRRSLTRTECRTRSYLSGAQIEASLCQGRVHGRAEIAAGPSVSMGPGVTYLSEVPVFRDQPAALDVRVAPGCPPGPA
jgi:hypothetical protein